MASALGGLSPNAARTAWAWFFYIIGSSLHLNARLLNTWLGGWPCLGGTEWDGLAGLLLYLVVGTGAFGGHQPKALPPRKTQAPIRPKKLLLVPHPIKLYNKPKTRRRQHRRRKTGGQHGTAAVISHLGGDAPRRRQALLPGRLVGGPRALDRKSVV